MATFPGSDSAGRFRPVEKEFSSQLSPQDGGLNRTEVSMQSVCFLSQATCFGLHYIKWTTVDFN